jgi:rod shape determining protein RodA
MLQNLKRKLDQPLLLSMLALLAISFVILKSASATGSIDHASRQMFFALLGVPVFLAAAFIPPNVWFAMSWLAYAFSGVLLLGVRLAGHVGMGAARWIEIAGLRFQPAELAKVTLVLALARLLSDNRVKLDNPKWIAAALGLTLLPMMLVLLQPDLGTALVFAFVMMMMLLRAGLPWIWLLALASPVLAALFSVNIFLLLGFILLLGALLYASEIGLALMAFFMSLASGIGFSLPLLWNLLEPYQQVRIKVFLNPEKYPRGAGYQLIQSKVAIGSGGFLGKGYLEGTQTQLSFLPERHTDFIFSVVGEEFGFLGATLVLAIFALLVMRALVVSFSHRSSYCALAMAGFAAMLFFHVFVNVGMTLGMMPVTGLPLPFLTYGGSFLWSIFVVMGLLINFSWHRRDSLS